MARTASLTPKAGENWLKKIRKEYEFSDSELRTATLAAECLNRIAQAETVIAIEGICISDRFGVPKMNPACQVERDNKTLFARLLRELGVYEGNTDARLPRRS